MLWTRRWREAGGVGAEVLIRDRDMEGVWVYLVFGKWIVLFYVGVYFEVSLICCMASKNGVLDAQLILRHD